MFTPGQGAAGQVHDFNPGILPNGLFWTMSIPAGSFSVSKDGRRARLRIKNLCMPDTFFFSNNVSVSAEIDVDVTWNATSRPFRRGTGNSDPTQWDAFLGDFRDAHAQGRASARETGFSFESGKLDSSGFYGSMGPERNGVFL